MALGILSIASELAGFQAFSDALLGAAIVAFGGVLIANLRPPSGPFRGPGMRTALLLFTWVAACGVLGTRLGSASASEAGIAAMLAGVAWLPAMGFWLAHVKRHLRSWRSWEVDGSWLLVVVATQSLAILVSSLSRATSALAALAVAAALWLFGLTIYAVLAAQITRRVVLGRISLDGLRPDYWIVTGALAISALAALHISDSSSRLAFRPLEGAPFVPAAAMALALGASWIPVQLTGEILQTWFSRSFIKHDWLRWSTVFPLGMLSVATHELGRATGAAWLETPSLVCLAAGLAVTAVTVLGHASAALAAARRRSRGSELAASRNT